ncbi:agip118 [Agrotis ipsilon multiple nucleopolyhedrovirus]|uniref:ChaB-like protein n=1 Tax=Agrotis ipsilon multiple nucleopolyhedrovirus TaxID=208013 RepID=B6D632_9ABAC|nr:agip118 [Agrotis ipsilon multiple nucleopolyhedrovirus]ACI28819.1 unknown [Agrotis ipsilon multiple nucleopolyhedrovirus]
MYHLNKAMYQQEMPARARRLFVKTFNKYHKLDGGDEDVALHMAKQAVDREYVKLNDRYIPKSAAEEIVRHDLDEDSLSEEEEKAASNKRGLNSSVLVSPQQQQQQPFSRKRRLVEGKTAAPSSSIRPRRRMQLGDDSDEPSDDDDDDDDCDQDEEICGYSSGTEEDDDENDRKRRGFGRRTVRGHYRSPINKMSFK